MADNLPEPKSRKESYLAKAAGEDVTIPDKPLSRTEQYLAAIAEGGGGGGGSYTAGTGIDISSNTISVDTQTIQEKLTAGTNITIADNVISAAGGGSITPVQTTGTSTTDVMSQNAVTSMIFADPENATEISIGNSNAGDSAVSIGIAAYGTGQYSVALGDHANTYGGLNAIAVGHSARARNTNAIAIGTNSNSGQNGGVSSVAIGNNSHAGDESVTIGENAGDYTQNNTVSIGRGAIAYGRGSVAIGDQTSMDSVTSVRGTVSIKANSVNYGYNGTSNYRLLTGLYDPQGDHDAATKGYVDGLVGNVASALNAINNGSN